MSKIDALYARYSSHAQDDSNSIEVQIQHCERTLGGPATHYIDAAKTGRALAGRTELQRLLREDKVLAIIQEDYAAIFDDADSIIEEVTARAQELSRSQRQDVTRIEAEIRELDRKSGAVMPLLADPEIDAHAKRAISRQLRELEQRREELQGAMGRLAIEAGETTEKLAGAVRQAMDEARASLARVQIPAELNRFVARFVGPIEVRGDGVIQQKSPGQMLSHPTGAVAGGGFEPPTSGL
jgi:chromosome segregation ATPase